MFGSGRSLSSWSRNWYPQRQRQRSGWQLHRIALDHRVEDLQPGLQPVGQRRRGEIQHFRGNGAEAAEQVQRHAGFTVDGRDRVFRCAAYDLATFVNKRRADGAQEIGTGELSQVGTGPVGAAPARRHFPAPVCAESIEIAVQPGIGMHALYILLEPAASFGHAPEYPGHVHAERVERIRCGYAFARNIIQRCPRVQRADKQRCRGQLLLRAPPGPACFDPPADPVEQTVLALGKHAGAGKRCLYQVHRGEVESIGREVERPDFGAVKITRKDTELPLLRIDRREKPTQRPNAAAGIGATSGLQALRESVSQHALETVDHAAELRLVDIALVDRILLGALGADDERVAFADIAQHCRNAAHVTVAAGPFRTRIRGRIAFEFERPAVLRVHAGTAEVAPGDDVDHAGDGIGAIDRRSTFLQHLDALDRR